MPPPRMTTQAQRDREEQAAQRLLEKAPDVLRSVETSYIFRNPKRRHGSRQSSAAPSTAAQEGGSVTIKNGRRIVPTFRPEELTLGHWLGTGGFAIVHEIKGICLDQPDEDDRGPSAAIGTQGVEAKSSGSGSAPTSLGEEAARRQQNPDDIGHRDRANGAASASSPRKEEADPSRQRPQSDEAIEASEVRRVQGEQRALMEKRALRNGVGRYAIKRLHNDLSVLEKARGRIDLAVEAKYLSVVNHPNIVRLRGVSCGDPLKPGYFLLLDRLYGTLDQRMNEWRRKQKECNGGFLGLGKKKSMLKELLVDRMTVAYDLAAAFFYLHENRIVYRDIKPENVGFDVRGDCKVFDLGLCKSLSPELKAKDGGYGYRLTGRAGSLPYMAVEVIKMETYDTKCDCYSFAILLWEMLCLQKAFKGLSPKEFVDRVVVQKERPPMPKDKGAIPHLTRLMLPEAWDPDPRRRPDMKRIAILIRGDLNDLTSDENVLNRTKHMDDRSVDSLQSEHDDGHPCQGSNK